MGVQFNTKGFVVIEPGGRLTWDSPVSAHSHKRVSPGGVLEAVPGVDGLFVRLLPREARQLSEAEHEALWAAALNWSTMLPASAPAGEPEPEFFDTPDRIINVYANAPAAPAQEPDDDSEWSATADTAPKRTRRSKGTQVDET